MKKVDLCSIAHSLLLLVLVAAPVVQARSATFEWAKNLAEDPKWDLADPEHSTIPRHGLVDSGGNTILAYLGKGATNCAVVKVDPTGRVLWVQRRLPHVRKLTTDPSGSIYVVGSRLTVSAYASIPQTVVPEDFFSQLGIPNEGTGSAYIAKLSAAGDFEWGRLMGHSERVEATDVAVLPDGSYYVAGHYTRGTAQFGNVTLPAPHADNAGHFFIVRFSAGGNVEWARAGVGSAWAWRPEIATDSGGNVVMTGFSYQEPYSFEEGHSTGDGGFVVRFNAEGKIIGTIETGSSMPLVAIDPNGNVFVSSGELNPSPEGEQMTLILHKYAPNGLLLWTKEATATYACYQTQLVSGSEGSCYMVGYVRGPSAGTPGEVRFDQNTVTTLASYDLFIAKYSPSGEVKWVIQSEGLDPVVPGSPPYRISSTHAFAGVDPFGNVALAGAILGSVRFGDTVLDGPTIGPAGSPGLPFAARIVDTESVQPTSLSVEKVADKLQLSWPTISAGFVLETAETVSSTAWTPVSSNPVRNADHEMVVLPLETSVRFFRLRKP